MPRAAHIPSPGSPAGKRKAGGKSVRRCKPAVSGLKAAGFYRITDLAKPFGLTGLGRSTLYDMAGAGTFPAPVKLSTHVSGWPVPAVNAWLDERGALPGSAAQG